MDQPLLTRLRRANADQLWFLPGDRVLVAVSGGPDSVALLHLLYALREELALHLEVAHLQHGIRGAAAKEDARHVADLCRALGVPFHLRELDLPRIKSAAGKGNLEALSRTQRYRFFTDVMAARHLSKLATAHTLDDQAETVLMWFLRGAGSKGLSGIAPRRELFLTGNCRDQRITVIRPLLEISKTEILEYLAESKIAYRLDESNLDPAYLRNWLRWHLLPELRQRFGERLPLRLIRQAQLIGDEDALLEKLTREKLQVVRAGDALRCDLLAREPIALQRRIVRLWIEESCGGLLGVSYPHVADILRLNDKSGRQARLSIARGWELVREYGRLRLTRTRERPSVLPYSYQLIVGETLHIPEARLDVISERLPAGLEPMPEALTEALFDGAFLTAPLEVRNFRRGDSYQPLGMSGHKKIKDLFIEKKVTRRARAHLPLLTVGGAIVWVPGCGRSDLGKVSAQSESLVRFKIRSTPV